MSEMEAGASPAAAAPPTAPKLQLVIRSREFGVEVLKGPPSRHEGEEAVTLEVDERFSGLEKRTIVGVSEDGRWIGVSGGGSPVEAVSTADASRVALGGDTVEVERFAFSPRGRFMVTWQRADATRFPDGSLRVWSLETGSLARAFHCKQLKKGGLESTLAWTGDERIALHQVTNTVQVLNGDLSSEQTPQLHSFRCDDVAQMAASPGSETPYCCALFVPERKGKPAVVKVVAYPPPSTDGVVCQKSFYRAQDVTLRWSPSGRAVLAQTQTDVDATGGSYYGGSGLYLLQARAKPGELAPEYLVPLPKEGPIADAKWEPTKGKHFVVVAGAVPPVASLYDLNATPLFNFGAAHRNTIAWAPHGRFLALCGFGNMAGDVDFWDTSRKKLLGSTNVPTAVAYGWAPDSRTLMAATLAPRMNVDNAVRCYRYDGSGPVAVKTDRQPLFDCFWVPADPALYSDRGPSPAAKDRAKLSKEEPPPKAYVPPSARGRGSALAAQIRAEREGELGSSGKANAASFLNSKVVPGMAPPAAESRNKKRRENQRKRKEGIVEAAALEAAAAPPPPPEPQQPEAPLTKDDLLKKQKALKKKLKQAAELQAKVDAGLEPSADQRDKLQRAKTLEEDLQAVEEQLAGFD